MNGLLIISGAFGVFRRDLVRAVGGLSKETLGEDMELTMRLHEQLRPLQPRMRIAFSADANAWTEAPPRLQPLRGQRVRWHIGLLDNLRLHRRMIGRRRFGAVGLLALPYTIAFEVLAPILQVLGYASSSSGSLRLHRVGVRDRPVRDRAARRPAADGGRDPDRAGRLRAATTTAT